MSRRALTFAFLACIAQAGLHTPALGGADAHGEVPPPSDGEPSDPILGWRPAPLGGGELAAGGFLELVRNPVVRRFQDAADEPVETQRILGTVAGLDAGFAYGVHDRITVGASVPIWFFTTGEQVDDYDTQGGPALGDLQLYVPVNVVLPTNAAGFGLSVVPFADLPTGPASRLIGDEAPGFGATAVVGVAPGAFSANVNLGVEVRPKTAIENYTRGSGLRGSVAVAYTPVDLLSVHLEARQGVGFTASTSELREGERRGSGSPGEVLLAVRGRAPSGVWWGAGVGRAYTSGVGAAPLRVFAGGGYSFRKPDPTDESTPAGSDEWQFVVRDRAGAPVAGASIAVGGVEALVTDVEGEAEVPVRDLRWRKGVRVGAPGFVDSDVTEPDEPGVVEVTLKWVPVPFGVWVKDQEGNPVAARVTASSTGATDELVAGADGRATMELDPGRWRVTVEADGKGTQVRDVVLLPGEERHEAEVILAPAVGGAGLVLRVADPEGAPVSGAAVLLDGNPFGSTASGGTLEIDSLSEGAVKLEVRADTFQEHIIDGLELKPGDNELDLVMLREEGSVKVTVRSPRGPVTDATLRFVGQSRVTLPVGSDGTRTVVLRPGTWQVLVSSPTYGLQQRRVVVPEEHEGLILVEVHLQPEEDGTAVLELRVIDPEGRPVDGAGVTLDGRDMGTTSTGGDMRLEGLNLGARALTVGGDYWRDRDEDLLLVEGLQERTVTLDWNPGTVRVVARHADGMVMDANARFAGPAAVPVADLGPDGELYTTLAPGSWQVLVASTEWGLQQRLVEVVPDSRVLHEVEVVYKRGEGGSADLTIEVVDPDGRPVKGAALYLDGTPIGATSSGGSLGLKGLTDGRRSLEVRADAFTTVSRPLILRKGSQKHRIQLDYAPGSVRVTAHTTAGEPVSDALVRFAGPSFVAALPVDDAGSRVVRLGVGTWQALVSSSSYGLQQKVVFIDEKTTGLTEVAFVMSELAAGRGELLVRVQDPDGNPVLGARVAVGKGEATNADGGVAVLADLDPGLVDVAVEAPNFEAASLRDVVVGEGRSTERIVTLLWIPRQLTVVVQGADGAPVDARVQFDGPADVAGRSTGADGSEVFEVRPGTWSVLASTAELGVGRKTVVVAAGDPPATIALTLRERGVEMAGKTLVIKQKVQFDFDSARISRDSLPVLDEVANTLLATPGAARVEIQGHSDASGKTAYNLELSRRRAQAVVEALVGRGVAPERLVARGYGPTRPIADNATPEGRAANRRVQFDVVETRAVQP